MGFLSVFKRNGHVKKIDVGPVMSPAVKEQVLKNREGILDVMSKSIKEGNRACPFLLGSPCIGELCMHFQEFKSIIRETKQETKYWVCAHVAVNNLTIELNQSIRELIQLQKNGHAAAAEHVAESPASS